MGQESKPTLIKDHGTIFYLTNRGSGGKSAHLIWHNYMIIAREEYDELQITLTSRVFSQ